MLKDANVLAEITRRQEEASKRADIKDDDVIRMLLEDREAARAAKQYGPAVRAAELLGRKLGMFKDRIDVNGGPERDRQIIESLAGEDPAKRAALKLIMGSDEVFEPLPPKLVVDNAASWVLSPGAGAWASVVIEADGQLIAVAIKLQIDGLSPAAVGEALPFNHAASASLRL